MFDSFTAGIYLVDFEYHPVGGVEGNSPDPACLVVLDLNTGVTCRYFRDQLRSIGEAPFDTGPRSLWVAFYAPAEMDCFIQLGWSLPDNVLDLFVEFRNLTNGRPTPHGAGLLGAMAYYGLTSIAPTEKEAMRDLILSGGPWSKKQETDILDYCQSDVIALEQLFLAMQSKIDLPRALIRGRYMKAVSQIQACGIPIDVALLEETLLYWDQIREQLIDKIDVAYGVYEDQTFKKDKFEAYLVRSGIPWPRNPTGSLDLSENAFRQAARGYPQIAPLHELRSTLSKLRLNGLTIGGDGRNRYMLSPFRSKTGRNQPSNVKAIYGPSTWMRGFIKPAEGMAIAYIDWGQQEFGIAGVLSKDKAMQAAYTNPVILIWPLPNKPVQSPRMLPSNPTLLSVTDSRPAFWVCNTVWGHTPSPRRLGSRWIMPRYCWTYTGAHIPTFGRGWTRCRTTMHWAESSIQSLVGSYSQ